LAPPAAPHSVLGSEDFVSGLATAYQIDAAQPRGSAPLRQCLIAQDNPTILPPDPSAIGGGNPFQGLGRADESAPSRRSQFESLPTGGNFGAGGQSDSATAQSPPLGGFLTPDGFYHPPESVVQDEAKRQKDKDDKNKERTKLPLSPADTPLKKAVLELQLRDYEKCLQSINQALSYDEKNAEAHYLKAVLYVMTRRFSDARSEYETVLRDTTSDDLSRRAKSGLLKLAQ